jgi:3-oxoacyl-[acyl-carrier-protein] synthase III
MTNTKTHIQSGVYLPPTILDNEEFERRGIILPSGKILTAEQIYKKIGIERRHISTSDETVADMAYKAAKAALKDDRKIDCIITSTSHPVPFHLAGEMRNRLDIPGADVFDIHCACSGSARMFAYIYEQRKKLQGKKVLLVASEKFSNGVIDLMQQETIQLDRSLGQTIFGDGAAAVSFTVGENLLIHFAENTPIPDPSGITDLITMAMGENAFVEPCFRYPVICSSVHPNYPNGYFTQNGPRVYEVVRNAVPAIVRESVKAAGYTSKDIQLVVVHPGSKRMVDALRESLEPEFRVFSDYADGNMSSVSLLYSFIKALKENRIGAGSKVILCGFGAGSPHLYSSTAVIELK